MEEELPDVEYEHIFADNNSTDSTFLILKQIAKKDPRVKVILNSRNVGPLRNIYNALKSASGSAIIPMLPADLQDPPDKIPLMYSKWLEGFLVVYGVRLNRQESFFMRMIRGLYYRIIKKMAEGDIPLNAGEFMLVDSKVLKSIISLEDQYPYIRGLIAQSGVKSASVEYVWVQRKKGQSKTKPLMLIDQGINGLVSTSRLPARIALLVGFVFSFIGILMAMWTFVASLANIGNPTPGIPTLIVALFFFGGIQLFFLGLIGEYVLSIHAQVRRSPDLIELIKINF
jgi:glycosyltransferase involved in cell wall biosynthesis